MNPGPQTKRLTIALSLLIVVLGAYYGLRWISPRWTAAVVSGKSPRRAVATVMKREHLRLSDKQETIRFENGTSITLKDERFYVYYRIDDFLDVDAVAREAILRRERMRFEQHGPRRMNVSEEEFASLSEGKTMTVQYAYHPNVLWGVSDEVRIPW